MAGRVKVRYVGDEEHYVVGRPAVKGTIEEVTAEEADSLEATGLYERVSAKSKGKAAKEPSEPEEPESKTEDTADEADDKEGKES